VDYRVLFFLMGGAILLVMIGLHRAGRTAANARILERGTCVEGEVLANRREGRITTVTYSFIPVDSTKPVTASRRMDGIVNLVAGQRVAICYLPAHPYVSLLVEHQRYHDGS
jgi:hypothetical protein